MERRVWEDRPIGERVLSEQCPVGRFRLSGDRHCSNYIDRLANDQGGARQKDLSAVSPHDEATVVTSRSPDDAADRGSESRVQSGRLVCLCIQLPKGTRSATERAWIEAEGSNMGTRGIPPRDPVELRLRIARGDEKLHQRDKAADAAANGERPGQAFPHPLDRPCEVGRPLWLEG
jgi:hypothetical protein